MPRALVTGAGGTFGKYICAGLIAAGYETLCVVRDSKKGEILLEKLRDLASGPGSARIVECDLSSGKSISDALTNALGGAVPLDILVNNAAVTPSTRQESSEGVELQWAVNVLGYHRVLHAALPSLLASPSPRVVFVASNYAGGLDLSDVGFVNRTYNPHESYRACKQANRLLAAAWAKRFPQLTVYSCHPGIADSAVARSLGMSFDTSEKNAKAGAACPLFCALESTNLAPSGTYYAQSNKPVRCEFASDEASADSLWALFDKDV